MVKCTLYIVQYTWACYNSTLEDSIHLSPSLTLEVPYQSLYPSSYVMYSPVIYVKYLPATRSVYLTLTYIDSPLPLHTRTSMCLLQTNKLL